MARGRGVNAKGRSKSEPFIRLHRGVTNSAAWKSLSPVARALLIEVWARNDGTNNGRIGYSVRDGAQALGVGKSTIARAFTDLEESGFLVCSLRSGSTLKTRHASEWELTTEPRDGQPAKALYRTHQPAPRNSFHGPTTGTPCPTTGTVSAASATKLHEVSHHRYSQEGGGKADCPTTDTHIDSSHRPDENGTPSEPEKQAKSGSKVIGRSKTARASDSGWQVGDVIENRQRQAYTLTGIGTRGRRANGKQAPPLGYLWTSRCAECGTVFEQRTAAPRPDRPLEFNRRCSACAKPGKRLPAPEKPLAAHWRKLSPSDRSLGNG